MSYPRILTAIFAPIAFARFSLSIAIVAKPKYSQFALEPIICEQMRSDLMFFRTEKPSFRFSLYSLNDLGKLEINLIPAMPKERKWLNSNFLSDEEYPVL